MRKVEGGMRI